MSVLAGTQAPARHSSGTWRVYHSELVKLVTQWRVRIAAALCVLSPFAFTAVVAGQSSLPTDTLFGRFVQASGFAAPLVILSFCGVWALPALTAVVAGDMFSAEDRFGTWKTILTRSVSRGEVFAGKAAAAATYTVVVVALLAVSSIAAGLLIVGDQPLVGLSGQQVGTGQALRLVTAAWALSLAPALGFTALGLLASLATRYGPAGVGIPVVAGLAMQLLALAPLPVAIRELLLSTGLTAWHGLLVADPFVGPLIRGLAVSAGYTLLATAAGYLLLRRRAITGS